MYIYTYLYTYTIRSYTYINTYIKIIVYTSLSSTAHGCPIHRTRLPSCRLRFLGLFRLSGCLARRQ